MKKILLTLVLLILFIPGVNAEAIFELSETNKEIYENATINNLHYNDSSYSCNDYSNCYNKALELFNDSGKQYYYIRLEFYSGTENWESTMYLKVFNFLATDTYTTFSQLSPSRLYFTINEENYLINQALSCTGGILCSFYELYDTNFNFIADSDYIFTNFYSTSSEENIIIKKGSKYPVFKDLIQYDSFNAYKTDFSGVTEVNLDNYEYVILSLKDYLQTKTFDTNLQVKGMIGITPVYEFGTVEKTEITDRCNISYSDYTNMRLYILKNDLINNPVYYVKSCEEGSSFKFDSSIFNITYITTDTVDNPVVTVGGTSYEVIPFNKLSTTANSNEENNFIPGESKNSLTDIIDNATDFTSDIWNAISSFMSLVTKFFNTLPEELRYLSITAFTVLIFISIIKFIRG